MTPDNTTPAPTPPREPGMTAEELEHLSRLLEAAQSRPSTEFGGPSSELVLFRAAMWQKAAAILALAREALAGRIAALTYANQALDNDGLRARLRRAETTGGWVADPDAPLRLESAQQALADAAHLIRSLAKGFSKSGNTFEKVRLEQEADKLDALASQERPGGK